MENSTIVKQVVMEVLEDYVNRLIKSKEKAETPLKSETPLKAEATEKQEAKEKKEVIEPLQPICPNKLAEKGREDYMKYLHKKVSNYV